MILDLLWGLCTVCLLQILYLLVNLAMEHQYFSWHGLPGQRGTKAPRRCYGLLGWSYWGSWQSFIMKIATKTIFFYWFFFFKYDIRGFSFIGHIFRSFIMATENPRKPQNFIAEKRSKTGWREGHFPAAFCLLEGQLAVPAPSLHESGLLKKRCSLLSWLNPPVFRAHCFTFSPVLFQFA